VNLAGLRASFARNKMPFALAGVALVGVLAWRARTAKTTTGTAAPLAAGTSALPATTSAGYTGTYSSTGTDLYSAIQPQLEAIGQTQAQLKAQMGQTQTPPIPVPGRPDGFYQAAGNAAIFQYRNGNLDFLNQNEYNALGAPTPTIVTSRDPLWQAPVLGGHSVPGQSA
jgi:hypothetical protein